MGKLKENNRLKLIREEKGLTQEQFAEILDMSTSGYKKLESGEIKLGIDKIQILNEKFGISADFVLFDGKTEIADAWEKALRLSDQEKWKLFLRLHAYLVRKTKNDMLIDEVIEMVDKAVMSFGDDKCGGDK